MLKRTRDEHLTTAEAAKRLGTTRTRINQLLISGELKGIKVAPRCWLIPCAAVEKLAAAERPRRGRPRIGDR